METGRKKLGFGLMRLPRRDAEDAGDIDLVETGKMVDAFLANGFTYFDTAWMYCGFQSEAVVKKVLTERHPRESYTLATKLHAGYIETKEDRDRIFFQQMEKTGASYFDYYLLHDVRKEPYQVYTELDCFRWLQEKKEKGLVKNIGFSFHDDAEFLDKVLTEHPEMEFVQLQINYLDWESEDVQSRKCYEVAVKHGKPVIVMEPVKGGTLAEVPSAVEKMMKSANPFMSVPSWAIRFAAGLPGVMMVLSGMSNMEQLEDNMSYMSEFQPLTGEERAMLGKAAEIIRGIGGIDCTGCSYCTSGCPAGVQIPQCFSLYNQAVKTDVEQQRAEYIRLKENRQWASECVGCGACETICPQELPIREYLKMTAGKFE